jgi:ABC-type sugar transport system permease subunit
MAETAAATPGRARRVRLPAGPYLLLLPAAVALAGVSLYPLFYGVRASLTRYLYGRDYGYTGLTNYRNAIHDTFFQDAMVTTAKFVVCSGWGWPCSSRASSAGAASSGSASSCR